MKRKMPSICRFQKNPNKWVRRKHYWNMTGRKWKKKKNRPEENRMNALDHQRDGTRLGVYFLRKSIPSMNSTCCLFVCLLLVAHSREHKCQIPKNVPTTACRKTNKPINGR